MVKINFNMININIKNDQFIEMHVHVEDCLRCHAFFLDNILVVNLYDT